jgi:hypothetical protein
LPFSSSKGWRRRSSKANGSYIASAQTFHISFILFSYVNLLLFLSLFHHECSDKHIKELIYEGKRYFSASSSINSHIKGSNEYVYLGKNLLEKSHLKRSEASHSIIFTVIFIVTV